MEEELRRLCMKNRKQKIIAYLEKQQLDEEQKLVLEYFKKHELCCFPYEFSKKYDWRKIRVFKDQNTGMPYVYWGGGQAVSKKEYEGGTNTKICKWIDDRTR